MKTTIRFALLALASVLAQSCASSALTAENARLEGENRSLRVEMQTLKSQNQSLRSELSAVRAEGEKRAAATARAQGPSSAKADETPGRATGGLSLSDDDLARARTRRAGEALAKANAMISVLEETLKRTGRDSLQYASDYNRCVEYVNSLREFQEEYDTTIKPGLLPKPAPPSEQAQAALSQTVAKQREERLEAEKLRLEQERLRAQQQQTRAAEAQAAAEAEQANAQKQQLEAAQDLIKAASENPASVIKP